MCVRTHNIMRRVRPTAYSLNNCADSDARSHARSAVGRIVVYSVVRRGVDAAAANVQSGGRWRQRGVSPNEWVRGEGSACGYSRSARTRTRSLTLVRSSR